MNRKPLLLFAICAAGAAFLWSWFLLTREPDPAPRRVHAPPDRTSPPPGKTAAAAWPGRGTPELRDRLREPAARWLDSRGRDAAGLIAIWDLCRDHDLLNEAARRFPDNPLVCRALVEVYSGDMATVLSWCERLIAVEPKNSEGHYLKAWALFRAGWDDEALDALRAAIAMGVPRKTSLGARADTLSKAATALGLPARDAALAPVEFLSAKALACPFYEAAFTPLGHLMEEARSAGDTATVLDLGRTALAAALFQRHGSDYSPLIDNETARNNFIFYTLGRLPDDWRWHPASLTTAEWIDHTRAVSTELLRARLRAPRAAERLAQAPDEVVVEYSRHFLKDGEAKADLWITNE